MPLQDFLRLRLEILRDPALQEQLRAAPDQDALFDQVIALGRDRGCAFSAADLQAVVNANNHAWICRGIWQ